MLPLKGARTTPIIHKAPTQGAAIAYRAATVRERLIAAASGAELRIQSVKPANPTRLLTRAALYAPITGLSTSGRALPV